MLPLLRAMPLATTRPDARVQQLARLPSRTSQSSSAASGRDLVRVVVRVAEPLAEEIEEHAELGKHVLALGIEGPDRRC